MDFLDAFIEIEKYAHLLLGKLAIEEGYIDYQKLLKALEIQRRSPQYKIGSILVKLDYLSLARLKGILQLQNKLRNRSPRKWPDIPDAVLKGMFYMAKEPMGQATSQDFKKAQILRKEYREKKHKKTLSRIFIDDMHLTSKYDLQKLRRQIRTENWQCSRCQRIYYLFNYQQLESIPCPICWEIHIEPYRGGKIEKSAQNKEKKHSRKKTPISTSKNNENKQPPLCEEKKFTARGSDELLELYATLQEMHSPESSLEAKHFESSSKANEQPAAKKLGVKIDGQSEETEPGKGNVPISKRILGNTIRIKMQELYQEIGQNIDEAPLNKVLAEPIKKQLDALQSPKYQRDLWRWKIYTKVGGALSAMLVIMLVVFFCSLTTGVKISEPKQQAFSEGTRYHTVIIVNKESKEVKNPLNQEACLFISRLLRQVRGCNKPSQEIFNSCLKQIQQYKERYSKVSVRGDLYNLTGRLYYYKIYLDRKQKHFQKLKNHPLAKKDWKKLWKKKAAESFKQAKKAYEAKGAKTVFKLSVVEWMPESKQGSVLIRYKNVQKALEDIEKWLSITD